MRFRAKWNIFILVSGHFLWTVYMIHAELQMSVPCGHFDRNEISFRMMKYHVNTTWNEIIWKEKSVHAFISSKQKWLAFSDHPRNEISLNFARNEC